MRKKVLLCILIGLFITWVSPAWSVDYGTITSGVTLSHGIDVLSKMDTYHFTGQAGEHVIFNAVTTAGNLDTVISLYAPSTVKEANTYDVYGNGGDRLDWILKETGTYNLLIEDNNYKETGDYVVSFLRLPTGPLTYPDDLDGGTIVSGQTKTAKINQASDLDGYQFTGKAGEHVIFNAVTTGGNLDTVIRLYAPSDAMETYTYDVYGNGDDRLDWILKEGGLYTIVVEDNNYKETGDYVVSFLRLPAGSLTYPDDLDGGTIVSGQTKTAKINQASDLDGYQFTGKAGEHVIFNAVTTGGNLDTVIRLYAPSDAMETYTYDVYGNGDDRLDWILKEGGLYTIVVEDNNYKETGDYLFSFLRLPAGPCTYSGDLDGGRIVSGQTKTAKINAASDLDAFQFYGTVGERVIANAVLTGQSLDTVIRLYAPSGAMETYTYDVYGNGGDRLDWALKEKGLYTIVVEDNNYKETGDYNLSFLKLPGGPLNYPNDLDGGVVITGQTKKARINAASDPDAFQFYAPAGERVIVNAVTNAGNLDTVISLYAPSGAMETYTYDVYGNGGDRLRLDP